MKIDEIDMDNPLVQLFVYPFDGGMAVPVMMRQNATPEQLDEAITSIMSTLFHYWCDRQGITDMKERTARLADFMYYRTKEIRKAIAEGTHAEHIGTFKIKSEG